MTEAEGYRKKPCPKCGLIMYENIECRPDGKLVYFYSCDRCKYSEILDVFDLHLDEQVVKWDSKEKKWNIKLPPLSSVRPKSDIFYHGTGSKKLKKIFKEGLKPIRSRGGLFLTSTPAAAAFFAYGNTLEGNPGVVLKVKIDRDKVEPDIWYYLMKENLEGYPYDRSLKYFDKRYTKLFLNQMWRTLERIPPENIKIYLTPKDVNHIAKVYGFDELYKMKT
jgi:predicted RNA-binding Zn-ribbon protein involved in translation (DUF1610 family)